MGRRPAGLNSVAKFHDLVGTVPDRVIAKRAGVSTPTVRNYRLRHGIHPGGVRGQKYRTADEQAAEESEPRRVDEPIELPGIDALGDLLALEASGDLQLDLGLGLPPLRQEEPTPKLVAQTAAALEAQLSGVDEVAELQLPPLPQSKPTPAQAVAGATQRVWRVSGFDEADRFVTAPSLVAAAMVVARRGFEPDELRITDLGPLIA